MNKKNNCSKKKKSLSALSVLLFSAVIFLMASSFAFGQTSETTVDPDTGVETTVETDADGNVTTTAVDLAGNVTTTASTTDADGNVTTTTVVTNADGEVVSTTTEVVDKDGNEVSSATVPGPGSLSTTGGDGGDGDGGGGGGLEQPVDEDNLASDSPST